jgi:hypothetical protein
MSRGARYPCKPLDLFCCSSLILVLRAVWFGHKVGQFRKWIQMIKPWYRSDSVAVRKFWRFSFVNVDSFGMFPVFVLEWSFSWPHARIFGLRWRE